MILDKLVLNLFVHSLKLVEFTFKVTLEFVACLNNFIHDFSSLSFWNTWT